MRLIATTVMLAVCALAADVKGPAKGEASDKVVKLEAVAYIDKASIKNAVGGELDEGIVVFEVKLTPKEGEKLTINRDDFILRTDKDGQRSTPYAPTQIAGSSTLRVKTAYGQAGVAQQNRPTWGGLGGYGYPSSGGGFGNTASTEEAVATMDPDSGKQKENPMLKTLKEKILPEKEIATATSGQLYFLLEGKQKVKDLELLYKTPAGRLSVRFKQDK